MGKNKLPYPPVKLKTDAIVKVTDGLSKTGSPKILVEYSGKCIYNERHAWVQNAEGKKVESRGLAIFYHDFCPEAKTLTGEVTIKGVKMQIITGKKLRNPDGTVHHIELELN